MDTITLNEEMNIEVKVRLIQKINNEPLFDDKPDFYFVVYKNKKVIFESKVMSNLDLSDIEQFIMKEGKVIDLGTFLINTNNEELSNL